MQENSDTFLTETTFTKMENKKLAVIDVGSNSVRIMYAKGETPLSKEICVTKIAKGLGSSLILQRDAIERTANALSSFYFKAQKFGAEKIFVFATEAVRKAKNRQEFLDRVYQLCGAKIDVVSGETEALLGINGALGKKDGLVIDVGGASTEIAVRKGDNIIYSKSLNIGSVILTDKFSQNQKELENYLNTKFLEYGSVPVLDGYAIGGTATSLAGISIGEDYDPKKVHGYKLTFSSLCALREKLYSMSVEERKSLKGLQPERAEVITCGSSILCCIMEKFGIKELTVSEADNLEGYLYSKIKR